MKITNWKRKLAASLVAAGLLSTAALHAAPLNTNLTVDPGFEDVGTAYTYGAYLNSWQDGTGTDYAYAVSAGFDNGGPLAGGGLYYFNSNYAAPADDVLAPGVVAQNIDISTGDTATAIATGEAAFSMSGFFSSFGGDGDFGTLHVEFLDSGGGSLGTSQVSDGDTTTWTQHTVSGIVPIGTATARLSAFGTALAGGPDGYIDNVDFQMTYAADVLMFLEVNTTTGIAALNNVTGDSLDIDYYEILSTDGSLDAAGWDSFQDQDLPAFPGGNGTGNGWEEAGNVGPNVLSESFLAGSSAVVDQASISLGDLFNTGGDEDLIFRYGLSGGDLVTGFVRYVMSANDADFNDDGIVDGDDFLIWQTGFGGPGDQFTGDANGDGVVDGDDFLQWQADFGGPPSGAAAAAVPEPGSLGLLGLILATLSVRFFRRNPCGWIMSMGKRLIPAIAVALTITASASASSTDDRVYRLGDDDGVSAGNTVNSTDDAASPADNLSKAGGNPMYVDVGPGGAGRPGAGSGELGIEFDGNQDYLDAARLGLPETSSASTVVLGSEDYTGISNRGFQLWVNPSIGASAEDQHIVMDTLQHGVGITAGGNWFMQYAGAAHDMDVAVNTGQWHHVMVVRPFGPDGGSRMYVNGDVVGVVGGGYTWGTDPFNLPMTLGANTGDFDPVFPGESNFFTGILDDLDMFIMGTSTDTQVDYGTFYLGEDNDFIADQLSGVAGDIDLDGDLDQDDKDDFIAGWMFEQLINDVRAGDLTTYRNGDLNFDGITDINDLADMQTALTAAGMAAISGGELTGAVPEPSTLVLLVLALSGLPVLRRSNGG